MLLQSHFLLLVKFLLSLLEHLSLFNVAQELVALCLLLSCKPVILVLELLLAGCLQLSDHIQALLVGCLLLSPLLALSFLEGALGPESINLCLAVLSFLLQLT